QDAGIDGGAAAVAVAIGQDGGASAGLGHVAAAADGVVNRVRIAAVEGQIAIVGHGAAAQGASGAAVANLQGAAVDGGGPIVGVVPGEYHGAAARFDQEQEAACVHNRTAEGAALIIAADRQRVGRSEVIDGARTAESIDGTTDVQVQRG